ncbi:MAG TPA: class I SAM-dependent methyltransferase [Gammaproteobacteria bacterium]|nr:class I SAM-dependent methyltransferase [Gammaproteobacteria bacterium]
MPAKQLTERTYWDTVHRGAGSHPKAVAADLNIPISGRLKSGLKRILGPRFMEAIGNYDDYLLWNVILPQFLQNRAGQSVVEIGSAPGDFLVALHRHFGLVPYGIEYSPAGADLNRRAFATSGLDPGHVIEADFLAPETHTRYRESFDIVLSRGFIEHFTDPTDVVAKHLSLLKPGGLLIVGIPNLRGLNYLLSWIFDRHVVAMHNLSIMTRNHFAALFPDVCVTPFFCNYYGTFNFRLINARSTSPLRFLLALCWKVQPALNMIFHGLFGRRGAETHWFSSNLLFVGIKR